jgi:hypothetical protein
MLSSKFKIIVDSVLLTFFIVGAGVSFILVYLEASTLNVLISAFYVINLLFLASQVGHIKNLYYSRVVDSDGNPVEGATVMLRDKRKNIIVSKRVTDKQGRYRFITKSGNSKLEINDKRYITDSNLERNIVKKRMADYYFLGKRLVVELIDSDLFSK